MVQISNGKNLVFAILTSFQYQSHYALGLSLAYSSKSFLALVFVHLGLERGDRGG